MASLLSSSLLKTGGTLGNVSASSLIKSAATLTNELDTLNDDEADITYENSAKTDDDLQTYVNYLNGRVSALNAAGTVTDSTKALTMSQKIVTATHSNISADISRENIQLMSSGDSGTVAGYQAKMNVIGSEYSRALAIGDDALAQTLESQYYSTSQSMQTAQTAASTASDTLAKSGATSENGVADTIEKSLETLNADVNAGGMSKLDSTVSSWVKANSAQLETLGVHLPAGAAPSYQDIVMGVTQAEINAHTLAANAMAPYDPSSAQSYYEEAQSIANGDTKVSTLAGSLSAQQIQNWTQNPQMFAPHEELVDGKLQFTFTNPSAQSGATGVAGYKYQGGQVVANYTGLTIAANYTSKQIGQMNTDLQKLGVSFTKESGSSSVSAANGVDVQIGNNAASFLKKLTGGQTGIATKFYLQPNGTYQLATIDNNGNSHIYEIAKDSKGLYGAFEQNTSGKYVAVGGQYGFDEKSNAVVGNKPTNQNGPPPGSVYNDKSTNAFISNLTTGKDKTMLPGQRVIGDTSTQTNIGNNPLLQQMISQSQVRLHVEAVQQQQALALAAQTPASLPALAPPPSVAPPPTPAKFNAPTVNPQPASNQSAQILQPTANPQGNNVGSNINQSGQSTGIKLNLPTTTGIKL